MRCSGRDAWKRVSPDVDEPSLRIGWFGGGNRTRGAGGERCGRAEQRNELTASQAGRQRLLIEIGVSGHRHVALLSGRLTPPIEPKLRCITFGAARRCGSSSLARYFSNSVVRKV